jgi:hypothetical protein
MENAGTGMPTELTPSSSGSLGHPYRTAQQRPGEIGDALELRGGGVDDAGRPGGVGQGASDPLPRARVAYARMHAGAGRGQADLLGGARGPVRDPARAEGDSRMMAQTDEPMAISQRLTKLAEDVEGDAATMDWIMAQLHERAFGLFLLVLALPCCIPFLYGVPQIVALPLMFISVQMLFGREAPWLPRKLGARSVSKAALTDLARRAGPWLRRIEAVSRPRFAPLTRRPLDQVVGLALVLFSASILVPLPGTNTVPGIAVVIVAMGLLQRDGILVVLGAILGTAWIATLVFAGATLASLIRGWLGF